MRTSYEEIVDVSRIGQIYAIDMNSVFQMAMRERFKPSVEDNIKRLFLSIDDQYDFMEGGALEVPGSLGDVERSTRFLYNNMEKISCIMSSLDTHIAQQIFHPCWWVNPAGEYPASYTIITYEDVIANRWRPVIGNPIDSIQYLKELKRIGKKQLTIWPYHCIWGTPGYSLEGQFAKMVYFHSVARKSRNPLILKGTDPYSEMYGIIKPEYSKTNFVNTQVLNAIEQYDEIYVVGEAASHCLLESILQIVEYFANRPEILQKITILVDCTSPITGCESDTKAAFEELKNKYGIKFAKSTDIKF